MEIIGIENDGTSVRFLLRNGNDYAYKSVPRGIMRVKKYDNDTITLELSPNMQSIG